MTAETKSCLECRQEILVISKRCKYCGADVSSGQGEPHGSEAAVDQGITLLALPIIASLINWLWLSNLCVASSQIYGVSGLLIITVAATAILIAREVRTLRPQARGLSLGWFVSSLLLWPIAYPLYLRARSSLGQPRHFLAALIVAAVFLSNLVIVDIALEEAQVDSVSTENKGVSPGNGLRAGQ